MIVSKKGVRWISSSPEKAWEERQISDCTCTCGTNLTFTSERYQKVKGFGGCFNELGWSALSGIGEDNRNKILDDLFDAENGCGFNFCRLPIGASDYSEGWYSCNETDGDCGMNKFSIERDRSSIIPYIREAKKRNPGLKLFASPWSPPTWMKHPKVYNFGTLIWEKEILEAYALYLLKFAIAYEGEGLELEQLHVQNEPCADQKFPSCLWTGEKLRDFIKGYLGPLFESNGCKTEIWLGTLNEADYDGYANTVLSDPDARRFITGVGYQWDGKGAIQPTHDSWPEMRLMQTENECGDGENTWEYARYVFNLCRHYFVNGAESYIYWNMVLKPGGMSTWGWKQNAMITVLKDKGGFSYNPEFYLMKHFSHFIMPGAVRRGLKGPWSGNALAFENPNGETVLVISNPFDTSRSLCLDTGSEKVTLELNPFSFNTIITDTIKKY